MGRVQSVTNPFQSGQTPGPSTVYSHDALGRTTVVTLPDGQTVQTQYSGSSVTSIDQVNRKMKYERDGLGRLIKAIEQDASGQLTQETTYSYDLLDNLTLVNQGGQTRAFKYDALSRLLFERIPEQNATINDGTGGMWSCKYTYTDLNQLATKTDARGVITTFSYDSVNRLTSVNYNTSGAPGVASTPNVTYNFDTSPTSPTNGLLLSVTVGTQYSESYSYDTMNRVSSLTRNITGKIYTTSYQYNTASQLTKLTYPSTRAVNVNHDNVGRLSSLVNDGDGIELRERVRL